MGDNLAKELLARIYEASASKDIRAVKLDIVQARARGDLTEAEERELLAAADERLIKKGSIP